MVGIPQKKFDKINFIYRDEKGIHSSYMYFRGLKTALERNKLLYYAYDVHSSIKPDMDALLKYPILCITGSQVPVFDLVKIINQKQFIAEINSESLDTRQGDLRQDLYLPVKERSNHFDIYFTPFEIDIDRYWGKPCYWLPSWVHTEVLDEITDPVFNKLGFVGRRWRREEFFLQDKNKIILAQNTIPKNDAYENAAELCKLINKFKILVNPISSISLGMTGKTWEYMACKRMCLCYLNETWMFKTKKLFKSNKDIVYFKSFEEMEAQYNYFINRPEKLKDIALSGYHIVRQFHNADQRAKRLAEIVLHHANGGRIKPEWNSAGSIMPVKTRK